MAERLERGGSKSSQVWIDYLTEDGSRFCSQAEAADLAVDSLLPTRPFPIYKGQRHMPGLYWSVTTQGHVPHESQNELIALMALDLDPTVVAIAAQPVRLRFPGGTVHHPDFLVACRGGERRLVDVTIEARLSGSVKLAATFEKTRRFCAAVGWEYAVVRDTDFDPLYVANLRWFAGFKCEPPQCETIAKPLVEGAELPVAIGDLVEAVSADRELVLPVLFHLVARGDLLVDFSRPLTLATTVCRSRTSRGEG